MVGPYIVRFGIGRLAAASLDKGRGFCQSSGRESAPYQQPRGADLGNAAKLAPPRAVPGVLP